MASEGSVIISLDKKSILATSVKWSFRCGSMVTMATLDIIVVMESRRSVIFVYKLITRKKDLFLRKYTMISIQRKPPIFRIALNLWQ